QSSTRFTGVRADREERAQLVSEPRSAYNWGARHCAAKWRQPIANHGRAGSEFKLQLASPSASTPDANRTKGMVVGPGNSMPNGGFGRSKTVRFGDFELSMKSGELRRNGRLVKLQQQPCKVLGILATRSGELITRD